MAIRNINLFMDFRRRRLILPVLLSGAALALIAGGAWWVYAHRNPYAEDGLRIEWRYGGASSTVPTVEIYAEFQGGRVFAPLEFHGLANPDLRFVDYNGDGERDIVFTDGEKYQVLAFRPSRGGFERPWFQILRNDVGWD